MRKETLKDKVLMVLQNNEDSRNNDVILWLKVLDLSWHRTKYIIEWDQKYIRIPMEGFEIKQSDVQRIRAFIQNKKKLYLPTSEEVRKARKISQDSWEEWLRQ